jgi:hypothetical protein
MVVDDLMALISDLTDLLMRNYGLLLQVLNLFILSFSIAVGRSFHTTENDEKSLPAIMSYLFCME